MLGCSIRAIWILNNLDSVVFSRRFPVVEKRWKEAFNGHGYSCGDYDDFFSLMPYIPTDTEVAAAVAEKKVREGSLRGFGIRVSQSQKGSDSWVDDPITRHILSLLVYNGENHLLWPLVLHITGNHYILVLPLVELKHLKAYTRMCRRSDCGNAVGVNESLSSLLIGLPSITGAFMVAHAIGDVIMGNMNGPQVVTNASSSVGGLLDSLTGSIGISGISARPKPIAAPVAASSSSSTSVTGTVASDFPKGWSRRLDKDSLRSFISSAMPFGTPLDLSYANISAIQVNGFLISDLPPVDLKQPAWKPYLYKGKQRICFTVHEIIHAAMYDLDEIPDVISISGQISCRAELEGLPDVSLPLTDLNTEVFSFHPCVHVPEQGVDVRSILFLPPLGSFVLMRYEAQCLLGPPINGFYQLSMVTENEGAFLFKLCLMEGYMAPLAMDFCSLTMPFHRRRVLSFDGSPSMGSVSISEHSIEWRIISSGRGTVGKSIEATFPGTIRFAPWEPPQLPTSKLSMGSSDDQDSDAELENSPNMLNVDDLLTAKMNKVLAPVDLEEPFSWQAYNYAKVSFKIMGGSLSGMSIDPKYVSIYPAVKAPAECSTQVLSGDYILWNTLGKCPFVATAKS